MKQPRIIALLAAFVAVGLLAGCAEFVNVQFAYPPNQNIPSNIKSVAVVKPRDYPARPASGEALKNMLQNKIQNAPGKPFQFVEREALKQLLDEKDFNASDFVQQKESDPAKLQGVDAFIFAEITNYETKENTHVETEMQARSHTEERWRNGKREYVTVQDPPVPVQFTVWTHSGAFGATFKLVDVNTGVIYAQLSPCIVKESGNARTQPPSATVYLNQAMEEAVFNYIKEIAPWFKNVSIEIDKNGGPGVKALKDGEWQIAINQFSQEIEKNPKNAGAKYDMAIAYAALSQYDKAIQTAQEAYSTQPNSMYSAFRKQVEDVKAAWEKHESEKK